MAHYAFLDENNIVTEVIVGKMRVTLTGSSSMDRSVVRLASAPHTIPTAVFTLVAAHLTARTTQGLATHLMRPVMRSSLPNLMPHGC
jgi:hypothetical protein